MARYLCADDPLATGPKDRLVLAVDSDEPVFFHDELDLSDGSGWWAAGQCDMDAESSASVGDVSRCFLVQGTDHAPRLVDAGLVHRRCLIHPGDGANPCKTESQRSVVVALAGTCKWSFVCGGYLVAAFVAPLGCCVADRLEPSCYGPGHAPVGLEFGGGVPKRLDVAASDWRWCSADGDSLLALCSRAPYHPQPHRELDYTLGAGTFASLGTLGTEL